ncbi:tyrosine-type recombinase/integrase [Algoriphagus sp. C2-6-M1]|uniref:tyrosine-type recombinase/integrase n=1 Tax=Algoriphagus persicinus TaxID=3108754 RepID=UPI002B3F00DD|nr:tyrosine-type recombinase/integrase [Algoriphagus sp. C2-6-M1]MEB2780815.1 tyrosine-type recombinase/integrase [Algoriphagus sp. C2-6-M1]
MIDMKITAVLNPKNKKLLGGEAIYLCINRKVRHYIHLKLDKIPKNAWSGKPLKWVNTQYLYAESHNRVISREIHHLKEIVQEFYKRDEVLTPEKLKNFYLVKYQGKKIKGVTGAAAPGASDTISSYIEYSLKYGTSSKKADGTRKIYLTLRNLVGSFRSQAVMADLDEAYVLGFIDFLRSDATDINSDTTVAKYVDRLKVIYREYCDQYGILFKKRIFERLDVNSTKRPDKIIYVNDKQYESLENLKFTHEEKRLEITRDLFLLLCNTALYYNDLIAIGSENGFDENLLEVNPGYLVLQGKRKKNGEEFWIPLNNTAKRIVKKYHVEGGELIFPRSVAISEQKFNQHLKVLADRINFPDVLSNKVGRKTFGTWTDRLGMEDNDIRMIFGHSPGSVLKKYYTERKTIETYQKILSCIQR